MLNGFTRSLSRQPFSVQTMKLFLLSSTYNLFVLFLHVNHLAHDVYLTHIEIDGYRFRWSNAPDLNTTRRIATPKKDFMIKLNLTLSDLILIERCNHLSLIPKIIGHL